MKNIAIGATIIILLAGAAIAYIGMTQEGLFASDSNEVENLPTRELGTKTEAAEGIIDYEASTERVVFQEGEEEKVKELIQTHHDFLNHLAGWGGVERLDHSELTEREKWRTLKSDVQWMMDYGLSHSEMMNDLRNAEALIEVSEEHSDEMSVRYLHRIFHDLDAELNGTNVDRIWNVTYAFGAEEEINKVYNYMHDLEAND
ncbi:hypothetical protein [Alkalicoccobacillus porphyridii]|uniref:Uncharacterized protein n=1 Tax=Alkalicoccobacillus porphyridii TaxID=2597270 RepID=A0A554A0K2_9BACI|nr:hypothetical protein [Alkalicoccobacillus porphyridii]TSB47222.1 hypothetical protein FN960_05635 [Alkalicoccobacillus porphyridii]